jgi:hypothetical protein
VVAVEDVDQILDLLTAVAVVRLLLWDKVQDTVPVPETVE